MKVGDMTVIKKHWVKTFTLALSFSMLTPIASSVKALEAPSIVSEAGIVVDYDTGEIIYEKGGNDKKFLASTTKFMTALLFAENKNKTDMLTYTSSAKSQPPYTLDNDYMKPYGKSLTVGDSISADTIMKGLLLFSGNDTAYVISDNVCADTASFVNMMNNKAAEMKLTSTHFENPNGLPINGVDANYSTPYELSVITKAAYENDWIREVTTMTEATVTLPKDTRVKLQNRNTELNKNGNIGGKTGVTDGAGTCFTGIYERDGRKLLGVVLKCDRNNNNTRFEDLAKMMDYSYAAEKEIFKTSGEEIGTATLHYKVFGTFGPEKEITVPVTLDEDIKLYKNSINDAEATISYNSDNTNAWSVAKNSTVPVTVSVKGYTSEVKGSVALTKSQLIEENLIVYISAVAALAIAIILLLFIVKLLKSASRNKNKSINRRRRRRY